MTVKGKGRERDKKGGLSTQQEPRRTSRKKRTAFIEWPPPSCERFGPVRGSDVFLPDNPGPVGFRPLGEKHPAFFNIPIPSRSGSPSLPSRARPGRRVQREVTIKIKTYLSANPDYQVNFENRLVDTLGKGLAFSGLRDEVASLALGPSWKHHKRAARECVRDYWNRLIYKKRTSQA